MSLFQTILREVRARLDSEKHKNEDIAQIISEAIGVPILDSQVSIKKGALHITAMPTVKMAIMVKKEVLLRAFKERSIPIYTIG